MAGSDDDDDVDNLTLLIEGMNTDITIAPETALEKLLKSKGPPRLLEYPPEIRNLIYAYAVCEPDIIVVRSPQRLNPRFPQPKPSGHNPPLSHVSRQLRHEALPIFYETNTFHLSDNITGIHNWLPLAQPQRLTWLALDLETSIMFFHTFTAYLLQPTRVVEEGGVVMWGTRERIIESLAERPRRNPVLGVDFLEGVRRERDEREREKAILQKKKKGGV